MEDVIAQRSWEMLRVLNSEYKVVVMGGWAAWLLGRLDKSYDIDILIDFADLARLRQHYGVKKNQRLAKYEIHADGFDIEIYLPYFSTTLAVPADFVLENTVCVDGFVVPKPDVLLLLKLGDWMDRRLSVKGHKDLVDEENLRATLDRSGVSLEQRERLTRARREALEDIRRLQRYPHRRPSLDA